MDEFVDFLDGDDTRVQFESLLQEMEQRKSEEPIEIVNPEQKANEIKFEEKPVALKYKDRYLTAHYSGPKPTLAPDENKIVADKPTVENPPKTKA